MNITMNNEVKFIGKKRKLNKENRRNKYKIM